ncbi:hypothetical protein ZWY2020_014421 [Hordeum vulgare]|nr:hypothetical protein ZWY2020_014421 [Hordeum vulgare]
MASSPPPPSPPSASTLPPPGRQTRSPPPPEWPCARCTLRNPRGAAACAACDAARPVDVDDASLGQPATVAASSSSRPLPPAQWSCARCTLLNSGSSADCAACRRRPWSLTTATSWTSPPSPAPRSSRSVGARGT